MRITLYRTGIFSLLSLSIVSHSAQLPHESILEQELIAAEFDPQRLQIAQLSPAVISLILSQAAVLEERFNKEIQELSKKYAQHNSELALMKENRKSAEDDQKIKEKELTVQNIEQQQIFRVKELKRLLDYLEEVRYQLRRLSENTELKT